MFAFCTQLGLALCGHWLALAIGADLACHYNLACKIAQGVPLIGNIEFGLLRRQGLRRRPGMQGDA
jgi:hypothetical protein